LPIWLLLLLCQLVALLLLLLLLCQLVALPALLRQLVLLLALSCSAWLALRCCLSCCR
jgi:hypothetical protein